MKKIVIDRSEIKSVNLEEIQKSLEGCWAYAGWHFSKFKAGVCEYPLYSYLSKLFNDTTILDIGTGGGGSSIAFASNPRNKVITYDILDRAVHIDKDNVEQKIGNFMDDNTIDYSNVSIIMIDVDPHDGIQEPPMIQFLEEINWKGLLVFDDIGPEWPALVNMWNNFEYEKHDLTDIGHWSGTGLINFHTDFTIKVI